MTHFNKYKDSSSLLIKAYEDDQYYKSYFISNVLAKHISDKKTLESIQIVTLPYIRFITNAISTLYNKKVIRTINYSKNKQINELFNIVNEAYNDVSIELDKYTFLSGTTALKANYDTKNDEFNFVLFPSNFLNYKPNAEDYEKLEELELEYTYDNVRINEEWSNTNVEKTIDGSKYKQLENYYGFIPFSFFRNKKVPNSFFCSPSSNLLDIQDYLTLQQCQIGNTFKFQAMSMLVLKGGMDLKQLNFGANAVNKIDNDDSLEFISPETDLTSLVNLINEQIKIFSRIQGIPDSLISASATSSGISLIISNKALDEYIETRSKQFIKSEKEAILNGIKVLGFHYNIDIPEDLEVSISHLSVSNLTKLSKEEIDLYNYYLSKNIISILDLAKLVTNTVYDDDAKELILNNKKINDEFLNIIKQVNDNNNQNQLDNTNINTNENNNK